MAEEENQEEATLIQLSPIMRHDGSLRVDILCSKRLMEVMDATLRADSGVQVILELCYRGILHPLVEVFGNLGLERFAQSRRAIDEALMDPRWTSSRFAMELKRGLLKAVKSMQDREPKARAADHLIAQPDVMDQLSQEVLSLEARCGQAEQSRRQQRSCRQDFWRLWEVAWAVRIYCPDERIIETLERLYARFSCLELREGERRKLQLPGGLRDPRVHDQGVIELW